MMKSLSTNLTKAYRVSVLTYQERDISSVQGNPLLVPRKKKMWIHIGGTIWQPGRLMGTLRYENVTMTCVRTI